MSPPILSCLEPGKDLYMYLVVFGHVVSAVLLKTHDGIQTLVDSETQYLPLEKLALALAHATRKFPTTFRLTQGMC